MGHKTITDVLGEYDHILRNLHDQLDTEALIEAGLSRNDKGADILRLPRGINTVDSLNKQDKGKGDNNG